MTRNHFNVKCSTVNIVAIFLVKFGGDIILHAFWKHWRHAVGSFCGIVSKLSSIIGVLFNINVSCKVDDYELMSIN